MRQLHRVHTQLGCALLQPSQPELPELRAGVRGSVVNQDLRQTLERVPELARTLGSQLATPQGQARYVTLLVQLVETPLDLHNLVVAPALVDADQVASTLIHDLPLVAAQAAALTRARGLS